MGGTQGKGESDTSPRKLSTKEKQAAAFRLRKSGATYEQIAAELGYANGSGARKAILSAMQATIQEPADEYRKLHRARLEEVLRSFAEGMLAGVPRSGEIYLQALLQLAKLDGLDAPKRIRFEDDLEQRTREAARKLGIDEDEAVERAKDVVRRMSETT